MEIKMIDERVDLQQIKRRGGKWLDPLKTFMGSNKGTMIMKCSNPSERKNGLTAIRNLAKKYKYDIIAGSHGTVEIYVVKA